MTPLLKNIIRFSFFSIFSLLVIFFQYSNASSNNTVLDYYGLQDIEYKDFYSNCNSSILYSEALFNLTPKQCTNKKYNKFASRGRKEANKIIDSIVSQIDDADSEEDLSEEDLLIIALKKIEKKYFVTKQKDKKRILQYTSISLLGYLIENYYSEITSIYPAQSNQNGLTTFGTTGTYTLGGLPGDAQVKIIYPVEAWGNAYGTYDRGYYLDMNFVSKFNFTFSKLPGDSFSVFVVNKLGAMSSESKNPILRHPWGEIIINNASYLIFVDTKYNNPNNSSYFSYLLNNMFVSESQGA